MRRNLLEPVLTCAVVALLTALLVAAAQPGEGSAASAPALARVFSVVERAVCDAPPPPRDIRECLRHLYWIGPAEGRQALFVDGCPGRLWDEIPWQDRVFSRDGSRFAYVAREGTRWFVVDSGEERGPYDEIQKFSVQFLEDGKHLTYVARKGQGWCFVLDGKEGPVFQEIKRASPLAPGRHDAYAAKDQNRWLVMADGVAGPHFDEVVPRSIAYSPDGEHLAYIARQGAKWHLVYDGRAGPPFDEVRVEGGSHTVPSPMGRSFGYVWDHLAFSDDSRHVAYAAREGNQWVVVQDGKPGARYKEILPLSLMFSPGGKRLVYAARKGQHWVMVCDRTESPPYDALESKDLTWPWACVAAFSKDGRRFGYPAWVGGEWHMVIDGVLGPGFDAVGGDAESGVFPCEPKFSPDGGRVAYSALRGKKRMVVLDGQAGAEHDEIDHGSIHFSRNGSHWAYAARDGGKWHVFVDGQAQAPYERVLLPYGAQEEWRKTVFIGDSGHTAYLGQRLTRWFLVLDGAESGGEDCEASFCYLFGPDSSHIAYALGNMGRWRLMIDRQAGPEYENWLTPRFPGGGEIVYWGKRAGTYYRVTHLPVSQGRGN